MKQRFSSLDVKVIAHELNDCLVSLRCANVYDLSSKILLIKFAKPDVKKQLVIDIGFRCHLTEFARTTAAAPSAFVARLRKVLKTRRLTSVSQVGTDRVLEFRFSDGQYRLFLEFFASGNIILTDADLKILTIARNVAESEGQEPQRVGLQYCLDNRLNYHEIPPISKDRIRNGLKSAVEKSRQNAAATKKAKGKPGGDLRKCLAVSITELPPVLVDHVLHCNNFDTSVKLDDLLENNTLLDQLVRLLGEARKQVDAITSSPVCKGYIFAKRNDGRPAPGNSPAGAVSKRDGLLYEDFHPFVPQKFQNDPSITVLEIQGYNQTVDDFFSSLEGQKLETRLSEREATARRKLEAARLDQSKRIEGLQSVQEINFRKAAAIEANVERVQEAMDSVNGLIAEGMDWVDISRLIEREKKRHNPVAELIVLPLKLAENTITLHIAEEEFDDEEEDDPYETDDSDRDAEADGKNMNKNDQAQMGLTVDINLTMSPWGNAREYHDQRRSAAVKQEKTQLQATKALKSTEQKINEDLKKGLKQEKALLQPIRTQMWFEKFIWFISSDGYLVIGGKDPAQNEMLYRRYLRKGDVYCHADLKGASSIVIKNNPSTPGAPIPPATLSQAGSLAVCSSEAWDSKAGMGAWWVNADQVSKSATTGDFLPIGSFMVKGEKNFLPPAQLLLGLGIVFKISDESKAKHVKHRLNDDSLAVASRAAELGSPDDVNESTFAKDKRLSADVEESSDDDSDGGKAGDDARDNPLQAFNNRGDDDALETVQKDISSLKVSESVASEGEVEQEDADTAKDAEFDAQDGEELASEPASEAPPTSPSRGTASSQVGTVAINKKLPAKRGQKGKAKKIASKYKDQDEEDRIAAEALIGATTGQKRAEEEMKAKADRAAELEAAKERRRAQHLRNQKTTAEHEEARRVMMDQDIAEPEPDETESATSLDVLVGTPLPGDEILEAIPVCAPWTALGKLKYRIKLQPGAMKKGKAVKEIVEKWKMDSGKKGAVDETARDAERMWPREVELIKALKPEEVMNSVPVGKVKIMTSGGLSGSGSGKGKGGKGKEQGKGGRGGRGSKK